uniref:Uncharacterized protein n=1 Tax=Anguilla anguilla TaxID=7936 RepID=A0A0E9SST3_ANGAN
MKAIRVAQWCSPRFEPLGFLCGGCMSSHSPKTCRQANWKL